MTSTERPSATDRAGNGLKVLEYLFRQPIIGVKEVQSLSGTSYPAANQLVQRLVELSVLREMTGQARNRRFRFEEYVALFTDDPIEAADGSLTTGE